MALTLGHQITATDTSITFAIDQGSLPGNFASDRFYALTEYSATEPATADVTLTAGGNTSVTITGLQPDRNYWIVGWRHFTDATPVEQGTGPNALYTSYLQSDYQTTGTTAVYSPIGAVWTEDWSQGFNRWIDEYPVFSERGVRTYPDDGAMGSRYYKSTQAPGDPHVLHTAQKWDWQKPLEVVTKVRMASASVWQGGFGVATGEYGYFTISKWGQTSTLAATVNNNAQAAYLAQTPISGTTPPVGTVQEWRIIFDGVSTWNAYIDGVFRFTFTWTPKAPLSLWCGIYNGMDVGAITVIGTPFVYSANCGMDLFARWSGTFSCREDKELAAGTFSSDFGGLTAPNVYGTKKSSVGAEGQPVYAYATGSWSARSPVLRGAQRLRYAGRQANGSMSFTVRRVADDSIVATITPASSTASTYDIPGAYWGDDLYVQVTGSVTSSTTDASVLHYLAAEAVYTSGHGSNTSQGRGAATGVRLGDLTLNPSPYWTQTPTKITVDAPTVGDRYTCTATATSPTGGVLMFDGLHADRFQASLNGVTWSSSIVIPAGTSTVYLGVVAQSGDKTLAARVCLPT